MEKKINGYIIYKGKSAINGEPIMGIVTMKSNNIKTGNMAQLWILRSDMHPIEVRREAKDEAICGKCILRQSLGGACYVNIAQAPSAVYRAYKKGSYPTLKVKDFGVFTDMRIRFGAYGDPFALPIGVLNSLKAVIKNNTSYTHQWKRATMDLAKISMASVNNIEEAKEASSKGWRYFRVTENEKQLLQNEILCPNSTHGIQCHDCKLCSGNQIQAKNIVIPVHGIFKKKFA